MSEKIEDNSRVVGRLGERCTSAPAEKPPRRAPERVGGDTLTSEGSDSFKRISANDSESSELEEVVVQNAKSELSKDLNTLKDASIRACNERERLPQPLFWSLFYNEIDEIKKKKHKNRLLRELLFEVES